jgi:3-oxoacyl-[acyl-carrier protein] reductase
LKNKGYKHVHKQIRFFNEFRLNPFIFNIKRSATIYGRFIAILAIFASNTQKMDLKIKDSFFIVTGAGSGFGRAIAEQLLKDGAEVLAIARTLDVLESFKTHHPKKLHIIDGDITKSSIQQQVIKFCEGKNLSGVVINAGGPPAGAFLETKLNDWDEAYRLILRWKVDFVQQIVPILLKQNYGRILFIESVSVKQPVENLVLSNSLRPAVVGFVKSLAGDLAKNNITLNILAPGYHNTAAMQRLFKKKSELTGMSMEEAKEAFEQQIPVGKMGEAFEMASLAAWLLSPLSRYTTGQTFSHDGGLVRGIFG